MTGDIRTLSRRLRSRAHHIEDALQAFLALGGHDVTLVHLPHTGSDIADYRSFLTSARTALTELGNVRSLADEIASFDTDLAAYKKARADIGTASESAKREHQELAAELASASPILSAVSAAVREYLRHVDPVLHAEYLKATAHRARKSSTQPAVDVPVDAPETTQSA